jgi:hypothetical protein
VDTSGNIFIQDGNNNRVRKVSPTGIITTIAGDSNVGYSGDGGPAISASLKFEATLNSVDAEAGVAVDAIGNLYIADTDNNRIRRVSPSGIISTFAGNGLAGFSGDGGPATSAMLKQPAGIAVDRSGNLYIVDGIRIRKVSASGIITTIAGNGSPGLSGVVLHLRRYGRYQRSRHETSLRRTK